MRVSALPLLAFGLLTVGGCGNQAAVNFNNSLAGIQEKLVAADKKWDNGMDDFFNGSDAKAKTAYEELKTAVAEGRTTFDELTVPEGEGAKQFREGFNKYLKAHEEAVPLYKEILGYGVKQGAKENARTREILEDTKNKIQQTGQALPYLQKTFARETGIKMKK